MYNLSRSQGKQLKELGLKARSDSRVKALSHWHSAIYCSPKISIACKSHSAVGQGHHLVCMSSNMLITYLRSTASYCFVLAWCMSGCLLFIYDVRGRRKFERKLRATELWNKHLKENPVRFPVNIPKRIQTGGLEYSILFRVSSYLLSLPVIRRNI